MKSIYKIITILITIIFTLVSCNNIDTPIDNDLSELNILEETIEISFADIYLNNDISLLNRKEIIIKIEMYEYLFRTFNITYDKLRELYEIAFINQNIDQRAMIGYSQDYLTNFTSSEFEKLKLYNFIGLSITEMEKHIVESGYDLNREKDFIKNYGNEGFSLSISEPIEGYDNETYIFVLTNVVQEYEYSAENEVSYSLTKYTFKEVDGVHKLSSKLYKEGFSCFSENVFDEPVSDPELEKIIEDFIIRNNLKDVNFEFQFDLKLTVEKLLDEGIE
ncbi:MAG: hypothetical protein JEZ08_03925 [Clostridiales bacterium]|nr:hypothetical protein [Clostridiales bacterium]